MRRLLPLVLALVAVVAAACGGDQGTSTASGSGTHTVTVEMADIRFSPAAVSVIRGERVRFIFHNTGRVAHDAFIGDAEAQAEHEKEMNAGGSMGGMHHGAGSDAITVEPGKTGELTHTFATPGTFEIGCHQAGHYGAGMKVAVTVS